MKFNLSMFFSTLRCFNVAAIVALATWHGYVFYLNQAIKGTPPTPVIELKLMSQSSTALQANHLIQHAI
ncbi:hypothetical protein H8K55_00805 [Undibacterium sp. LX15W]|uniref:Uncharacterized protein n=1 Tax=Undibacterium flavidum TaxID=2762297 RepID=A0ABR6Y664_9BURK|nr:hypothetical protein [Undibacterium flavidum]